MALFDSLKLRELEIRNRIMMSPMSQRAAAEDGLARDWHLVHYGSRAVGGCGLVMVEDTAVTPSGRTSRSALGMYEPRQAEALGRIVAFCHAQGAAVGLQLAHAGRKSFADTHGRLGSISASAVAFGPDWVVPREAGQADIDEVVDSFVAATRLALDAGFDVVEVHAAHGYLLHQFLSPLTNFRKDSYGGDSFARGRLLLDVVRAVRAGWPAERPLFVRLPAGDGEVGGLGIEETAMHARACGLAGVDLIDVSGGTPLWEGRRAGGNEVLALAAVLAEGTSASHAGDSRLPFVLGGGIVDGGDAEVLINDHGASLVSVGRPLLADPYWPLRAAVNLGAVAPLPPAYANAWRESESERSSTFGRTVFSPDHSKQVDGSMGGERR
jgi:2,4-dienoyl-CoA reductase-like NADH-dependent reductase (Old Yellow Enzyme family)